MPLTNQEAVYDQQIAPLMAQILAICQAQGIPMFATFQYGAEHFATSALPGEGHSVLQHFPVLMGCVKPEGVNLDQYLFWLIKRHRGQAHSSLFLQQLGLPAEGDAEAASDLTSR